MCAVALASSVRRQSGVVLSVLPLLVACNGNVDRDEEPNHPGSGGGVSTGGATAGMAEGGASGEAGHALGGTGGVVPVYCDTEDNVPEGFVCYLGHPCPRDAIRESDRSCYCLGMIDKQQTELCPDGYICSSAPYSGTACYLPGTVPQNGGPR